ncbi:MAG: hypothetical protein ACQEP7_05560, partial [bacterium]
SWFTNPRSNSSIHMYATGSGEGPDQARTNALNELAGFFHRTVGSRERLHQQESFDEVLVDYEQEIRSEIDELELNNYEITRVDQAGSDYYVEARLDCRNYAGNLLNRLKRILKELKEDFRRTGNPMVDFYRMHGLRNKLQKALTYLHVLAVIEQNFEADINIDFEEMYSKLRKYNDLKQEARQAARVVVTVSRPAKPVAKHLPKLFQEADINVAVDSADSPGSSGAAEITVNSNEKLDVSSKGNQIKVEIEIAVYSSQGDLLSTKTFTQTGHSKNSFSEARDKAQQKLRERLESMGAEKLLGIEKK